MRKASFNTMATLDGFFERPNGEIDWHYFGEGYERHTIDLLSSVATLLFGGETYQLMAAYRPFTLTDNLPKIVFPRLCER